MHKIHWLKLLASIALAEAVGGLSALLSGDISAVYRSLILPPLAPPGWLFPLVWTLLFAMMGVAAYLVGQAPVSADERRSAWRWYAAQLLVNMSWPVVFFRFQLWGWALAVLIVLIVLVIVTTVKFARIKRLAGYLLLPYLLWLLFAAYLNLGVVILN